METWFLIVLELLCATVAQGQKKVCFAPVACSAGDVTSSEWMEVESKSQCTDKHSEETVPTQAKFTERRIKTLINESVAEFRSELTKLLASKADSDELKRLRNDVNEMNQTLNQIGDQFKVEMKKVYDVLGQLNASKVDKHQDPTTKSPDKVCPADGSITFKNKCYWFILHNKTNVNFDRAQALCTQSGGKPGDILDQEHYNTMEAKFREIATKTKWFWLGMTINQSTKAVSYSNGTRANFLKWYPGYPKAVSSYTKLRVQITESPSSGSQGMYNSDSRFQSHGAFCQEL